MATYDDSQKARIMAYPIEDILRHFGKRTDHQGEMYYSPFRDESSPSFHIKRSENIWMDFGSGKGGNVLTLVNLLAGISLVDCWDYVAGMDGSIIAVESPCPATSHKESPNHSKIIIDSVQSPFRYRNLIRYAESRGIPGSLLERYCSEVTYHVQGITGTAWTGIGFPAGDGWVLRHSFNGPYAKRCTGSSCSLLGAAGERVASPTCGRVEVFEGFFDFLSWLVISDRTKPFSDICVLNSVNNLSRGMDFIRSHRDISCWMDSDDAGRKAFYSIQQECPGARSHLADLQGCKDVNELLLHHRKQNVIQNNIPSLSTTIKK